MLRYYDVKVPTVAEESSGSKSVVREFFVWMKKPQKRLAWSTTLSAPAILILTPFIIKKGCRSWIACVNQWSCYILNESLRLRDDGGRTPYSGAMPFRVSVEI
jgi:2-succinyl-5-enolpyruvyl-6-hydroxy-3-cyclohexene-1-carboxylate synthase